MILALFRKAVLAGKVTVMRNMKAEGLDNCLTVLEGINVILVDILGKELLRFRKLKYFQNSLFYFILGEFKSPYMECCCRKSVGILDPLLI